MVPSADGAVALRPLGVGELLDGAVRGVKRNARAAFTITLPFAVVTSALVGVVQLATYDSANGTTFQALWSLFVGGLFVPVLTGLLAPIFTGDLLGRHVSAGESLTRVGRSVLPLLALALVVAVCEEAGIVLLVVGGFWLWGIWSVAAPALVVERTGAFRALGRSFALVRNSFWRAWGTRALGWVVKTVLGVLVTVPFTALAGYVTDTNPFDQNSVGIHRPGLYVSIIAVGLLLRFLLTAPISCAIDALLYLDLRMRREGMDIVLGLQAAGTGADPANPAPSSTVSAW